MTEDVSLCRVEAAKGGRKLNLQECKPWPLRADNMHADANGRRVMHTFTRVRVKAGAAIAPVGKIWGQ